MKNATTLHQVPPRLLLPLNRLKQTLEIPRPKAIKVIPLYNLNKHRRPVHQMLREQLQQIPALVKVDQNVEALEHFKVLVEHQPGLLEPQLHAVVVRLGDLDELDASGLEIRDRADDIVRAQGDVLHARPAVEVDVLLDLGLLLALGWLVDGHLDHVVGAGHDDGFQR